MKKFQITIPKPCHENWDGMTQQQKGKFCGSCQKNVVDFSNMSDRQIADFFKRPAGSVCGRFHSDQLERPIDVPRKRIPWVKYFFHVTWPALVLFFKSCGPKLEVMGDISIEVPSAKNEHRNSYITMGTALAQITPEDSLADKNLLQSKRQIAGPPDANILIETEHQLMGDTVLLPIDTTERVDLPKECQKPMDTVNIISYETTRSQSITGAVTITSVDSGKKSAVETLKNKIELAITAFPNPVRVNEQVTVKASFENDRIKVIQLLSASGQLITTLQNNVSQAGNARFFIPSGTLPGTYFIQVFTEKHHSKTVKILVIN